MSGLSELSDEDLVKLVQITCELMTPFASRQAASWIYAELDALEDELLMRKQEILVRKQEILKREQELEE